MGFGRFTQDNKNRKVHLESFKIGAERKEVVRKSVVQTLLMS